MRTSPVPSVYQPQHKSSPAFPARPAVYMSLHVPVRMPADGKSSYASAAGFVAYMWPHPPGRMLDKSHTSRAASRHTAVLRGVVGPLAEGLTAPTRKQLVVALLLAVTALQ